MRKFAAAFAAIVLCLSASFTILPTGVSARSARPAQGSLLSNVSLNPTPLKGGLTFVTVVSVSSVPDGTYQVSFTGSADIPAGDVVECAITVDGTQATSAETSIGASSASGVHAFAVTVVTPVPAGATVSGACNDGAATAIIAANAQITLVPQDLK